MLDTQVIFCGENPEMRLVRPDNPDAEIAFASYWRCAYSPYGSGQLLALHIEPKVLEIYRDGLTVLLADNLPLGRALVDELVQYFPGVGHIPFTTIKVETAALSHSGDGQKIYRVNVCSAGHEIDITWENVLDVRLPKTYSDFIHEAERGTVLDVSNVICPVGQGSIVINGARVGGDVYSFHDGTIPRSTAFLAFSETWVRRLSPPHLVV
ncbi:MAG: hypothetical protein ABI690_29165 [Chloroflexota bacterium]